MERFQRATGNSRKLAIFLALIALFTAWGGWVHSLEADWVLRISSIAISYAALKCFLIHRCLRASASAASPQRSRVLYRVWTDD